MILGIDYGSAKVGLAIADETSPTPSLPLKTIRVRYRRELMVELGKIIEEYKIREIVVGDPFAQSRENGGDNKASFSYFLEDIRNRFHLPVHLIDEFLTTQEAQRFTKIFRRGHQHEDALAAAIILDNFRSRLSHG